MRRPLRQVPLIPLALGSAALLVGLHRLTRTPEWTVFTGDDAEKIAICRSVVRKSPARARFCLERLLRNRDPGVRIAAIEGLMRRSDLDPVLGRRVASLTQAGEDRVKARALEYMLRRHARKDRRWLGRALAELTRSPFRRDSPHLLELTVALACETKEGPASRQLLDLMLSDPQQDPAPFRPMLESATLLTPARNKLVGALDRSAGPRKLLLLQLLTKIDGTMKGFSSASWQQAPEAKLKPPPSGKPPKGVDRFTVEAEWACDIRPNYQIDTHDGEICLHLDEGAGGFMSWLQRENSTVDIGSARFRFAVAKSTTYEVWIRCWMENKCGNSVGMEIDRRPIGYFDDRRDIFRKWHWKRAASAIRLREGQHTFTFAAWEDGTFVDKVALMPARERFNPRSPPPLREFYDPRSAPSLSISPELQHQARGTTQTVTVWVRRQDPAISAGTLRLKLPPPLLIRGRNEAEVTFAQGSPVARASFKVHAPKDATGGEVLAEAEFAADQKVLGSATLPIGLHYDWYTTGPLDPWSPRCRALMRKRRLEPEDVSTGWTRYPTKGYDRYRRFAFERAYGESSSNVIFLTTEIEVAEGGAYLSLLTLDDYGYVFIDGRRIAGRPESQQPGEGLMMMNRCQLAAGRHQVFLWVCQADFRDPTGYDADRHSYNNWIGKWLLRRERHVVAEGIRGVPLVLPNTTQ